MLWIMDNIADWLDNFALLENWTVTTIKHLKVCECLNLDHLEEVDKRGYNDADDPRNLFAAMYGGVYKRSEDPYEYR